jgi:hypothetical protein
MRRAIELVGVGTILELSRGTGLKIRKQLFHLDALDNGTWRLTFTTSLLPSDGVLQGVSLDIQGKTGTAVLEYAGYPPLEMRITRVAPITPKRNAAEEAVAPQMIHLDQADDGTWKLLYSKTLVPDISKLSRLHLIREGEVT